LALMVKLGADPLDALRAGTRNGAELLHQVDRIGTIEAGKLADMVLVAGDVVADINRLCEPTNVRLVLQGGRVVHGTPVSS
jgi:imidazolonepropionase-like amidohydrolase